MTESLVIAIGLIEQGDNYILQRREGKGINGAIGLMGCFGGQRKVGETPEQTVLREIMEETSLSPRIEEFEKLGFVNVFSDRNDLPVRIAADIFKLIIGPDVVVEAKEGRAIAVAKSDVRVKIPEMTPATRALFHQIMQMEY